MGGKNGSRPIYSCLKRFDIFLNYGRTFNYGRTINYGRTLLNSQTIRYLGPGPSPSPGLYRLYRVPLLGLHYISLGLYHVFFRGSGVKNHFVHRIEQGNGHNNITAIKK
jgi:hypothetical protein